MKPATANTVARRNVARWVLLCLLAAGPCHGQTGKGSRQKVTNPLNDLLDEARRAIDAQNYQAAVAPLEKFIAEKEDFAYAHFQLGYAYTALGRTKDARGEYQRAMALDPKMAEAALNLGILLLAEEPAAAVAPLERAVELLPTESRPRTLLGLAHEKAGDPKRAAAAYEASLALEPRDVQTSLHLGQLLLRENRAAEAEPRFRAVLSSDPLSRPALLGLAASLEAGKKPEAVDAYRGYLKVEPGDAGARKRLVNLLLEGGKGDEALAELESAEKGGPPSLESLKLRADILIGQKKWKEAAATLQQAVAIDANDAALHGGLGRVYLEQREFPGAESELKAAIRLDGRNVAFLKDLATTYYLGGNYPAALGMLDEVARREAATPGEWFIRALCYDKLQQTKAALDAYQKFLEADQNRNPDQVWQAEQRIIVLKKTLDKKR
jgi:tetratricopeptide (TPR) repeat protein